MSAHRRAARAKKTSAMIATTPMPANGSHTLQVRVVGVPEQRRGLRGVEAGDLLQLREGLGARDAGRRVQRAQLAVPAARRRARARPGTSAPAPPSRRSGRRSSPAAWSRPGRRRRPGCSRSPGTGPSCPRGRSAPGTRSSSGRSASRRSEKPTTPSRNTQPRLVRPATRTPAVAMPMPMTIDSSVRILRTSHETGIISSTISTAFRFSRISCGTCKPRSVWMAQLSGKSG